MPSDEDERAVALWVAEPLRTPALSLVLGYGAMAPFPTGVAAATLLQDGRAAALAADLTVLWGCAILLFLSGVRRGLSFRTPDGPTFPQIATTLWLFAIGLTALVLSTAAPPLSSSEVPPVVLLLVGYVSLGVLDPWAASRGEAPPFFARLRPVQMLIPVASLATLLVVGPAR